MSGPPVTTQHHGRPEVRPEKTKEQLGGFWVTEVDDLDAALAWAEKCAQACWGLIEVRPFDGLA